MIYNILNKNISTYNEALKSKGHDDLAKEFVVYNNPRSDSFIRVHIDFKLTEEQAEIIYNTALKTKEPSEILFAQMVLHSIKQNDNQKMVTLKGFSTSLKKHIMNNFINGWIFKFDEHEGYILPYLVKSITFHKTTENSSSFVRLTLGYNTPKRERYSRDKELIITFTLENIRGSVVDILSNSNLFMETEDLISNFKEKISAYKEVIDKQGKLYLDTSKTFANPNIPDSRLNRLIQDDYDSRNLVFEETVRVGFCAQSKDIFNLDIMGSDDSLSEDEIAKEFAKFKYHEVPYHPLIKMYDIDDHIERWVMSDTVKPYVYDTSLADKIVLPEMHRELIEILVNQADVFLQDVVKNKSGGTSILCRGGAGLGKTLTAEVYSEITQTPLYSIQCGQLGTEPDKIEKELQAALDRAERWGSILLIDEADTYIRRRGDDVKHNAIVSVFLRKMERYSGIMFLTTNRVDDIDDAIISRCIAVINYEYPSGEEVKKIWKILADNYKVAISDEEIDKSNALFRQISGRDIKELMKLAFKYQSTGKVIDSEAIRICASFRGIPFIGKEDQVKSVVKKEVNR